MEIFFKNSDGDQLCFTHAVKAVIKNNEHVCIQAFDDSDCGQSGAWWLYGNCKECQKEIEKE